jgi:hypothetical protein
VIFSRVGETNMTTRSKPGKARKQRKQRVAKKRPAPRRSQRIVQKAPHTAKQYLATLRPFQDEWDLITQVPGIMRSQGFSLTKASKQIGVNPRKVLRLARSAFRKRPDGRYVAKATDRLLRILVIPSKKGLIEIAVRDSRQASLIGEYWNALDQYLQRGGDFGIKRFKRIHITDASGRRVRLLTGLAELRRQASAGVLRFESLYGGTA